MTTLTRRDMWAVIAAAVAGGLPVPETLNFFYDDHLRLQCETFADAQQWAIWLGHTKHETYWVAVLKKTAHDYEGERGGWRWYIGASVPGVASAALAPDSLPAGVEGIPIAGATR